MSERKGVELDERLQELCGRNQHAQAEELARAALENESIEEVSIDEDEVRVRTPRFRGVHRIPAKDGDTILMEKKGEYAYTGADVDLTVSTTATGTAVYELVQTRLADEEGAESDAAIAPPDAHPPLDETSRSADGGDDTTLDETSRSADGGDDSTLNRIPLLGWVKKFF